jgi:tungstate transport system substrate-binding protein
MNAPICRWLWFLAAVIVLISCGSAQPSSSSATSAAASTAPTAASSIAPTTAGDRPVLRLATTTSTADSGLLDAILPDFEARYNAKVDVVAVGTGQALKLGENGDADVVLVHARAREDAFVAAGQGINRRDVMYNDFIIVGPAADPAGIKATANAVAAFKAIAAKQALFDSRGDDSGTYTKELSIWASTGMTPTAKLSWYKSLGQGMGETLITANEQLAYTLTDRGTYLAMRDKLPNLVVLLGGATIAENKDRTLLNPYGVIPVNPATHPGVKAELAEQFATWLVSAETQAKIGAFGKDRFGQSLFVPGKAP